MKTKIKSFTILAVSMIFCSIVSAVFGFSDSFLFLGQLVGADKIRIFGTTGDDMNQILGAASLLESGLDKHNPFWSFSYGLGGDTFTEMTYYYSASPLFYVEYLIKSVFGETAGSAFIMQKWKLIFSIVKQFLSMLGMYFLLTGEKKEKYTAVIGAAVYGGSFWFIAHAYFLDFMTEAMLWLPLFMIALNRYFAGKSFIPLACVIALTVANNFYFGFNSCLFYATVFIIFSAYKKCGRKEYFINLAKFTGISALGILLASFAFLPAVNGLLSADRGQSSVDLSLLPSLKALLRLPLNLTSDSFLSLPFIIFYAFVLVKKDVKRLTKLKGILCTVWLAAFIIPLTANVMNGMSYVTERWYYIVIFTAAYSLPDFIEEILHSRAVTKKGAAVFGGMILIAFAVSALVEGGAEEFVMFKNTFWIFALCGALSLFVLFLIQNKYALPKKAAQILLIILICVPAFNNNFTYFHESHAKIYDDETAASLVVGGREQRLANQNLTPAAGEFYRVDDLSIYNDASRHENRAWYNGNCSVSAYASEINGDLHRWIKRTHDVSAIFDSPSFYRGFGRRLFLENAWGVKYKISAGDSVPYGYAPTDIGGITVLKNRYSNGIDLWYDSVLGAGEFEKLDYAQRDAALLQTAVTETKSSYPAAMLDDTVRFVSPDVSQFVFNNCELSGETLTAGENAEMIINLPENGESGEYLLSLNIASNDNKSFDMNVNGYDYSVYGDGYQYSYDTNEFSFCIDGSARAISFKITEGEYTVANLRLVFSSYGQLEKWTAKLNKYNLENLVVDGEDVSGTIENAENGILALSIPFNKGWSCTVDGKKTELIKVNGVFTGVELEAGRHEIKLHFVPPYLISGIVITAVSAAFMTALVFFLRRKRA